MGPVQGPAHATALASKTIDRSGSDQQIETGSDGGIGVAEVQMEHDARPSITVNIVNQFNEFLKETAKGSAGQPDNLQKLKAEAGITLTLTNTEDPDGVGCFVQYRAAWYIAGEVASLINAFLLFDRYFQFKNKQLARATPFEINIYPYVDVELPGLEEQMQYTPIKIHQPAATLPLKRFDAQPPASKRILALIIEPTSDKELNLVITRGYYIIR